MRFSKLEWSVCPHCHTTINNSDIISMTDLNSSYGQYKTCPMEKCGNQFIMWTKTTLTTSTEKVETK